MIRFNVTDGVARYAGIKQWAQVPGDVVFERLSQIAVDEQGKVYAAQRVSPAILVFGPDGAFETAWDHPQLPSVHGIHAAHDGHLYITSFDAHQVLKFTPEGVLVLELGRFNHPHWTDPFNAPTGVAVAEDGDIYVSDGYANARVHRFAPDGTHLASWGKPGSGPGQFKVPHGIWVTRDDRVLVLDRDNDRVQIFSRSGALQDIWEGFTRPMSIWGDREDHIFISDQTPRILRLDRDGQIQGIFRGLARSPHGIAGDVHGNLYIADQQPNSITKYEIAA